MYPNQRSRRSRSYILNFRCQITGPKHPFSRTRGCYLSPAQRRSWHALAFPCVAVRLSRPGSYSQKNVNCTATAITSSSRRVGNDVAAHAARAKPPLNVFLQDGMVLVRVTPASMDDPDTCETCANSFQQELLESEARVLKIQTMKVQMCLHGK